MVLIAVLAIIVFASMAGEFEAGIAFGLLAGLYLLQRAFKQSIGELRQQIERLQQQLSASSVEPSRPAHTAPVADAQPQPEQATANSETIIDTAAEPVTAIPWHATAAPDTWRETRFERLLKKALHAVAAYFTDGNVFVRVGLLVLFFGVAFLLKYAAENSRIPLELRFLGAAIGGLGLVVFGWRLRNSKQLYALLLQGGGIGIIYITIFASYRLAELIPSTLTLVLLVLFALITAALAVLQNARSLAIFGVLGGFLAPFLASSGSGDYVALFSYYVALNLVIFAIAWYKAWRMLNLLGFAFTFGTFSLWFALSYRADMLWSAGALLLVFFLMYSALGVLYALRQTHRLQGLVDGTLVFGTPLLSSTLAMGMLRQLDYGIAIGCVALGAYYVLLARFLWGRIGAQARLLAEALLAIGVVFATLAIPYALDGHWSSAVWALEAAGILWVSLRQHRQYAQWFALLLQFAAAALFWLSNAHDLGDEVWINPAFLGGTFIALGALISARLLYQLQPDHQLRRLHSLLYVWGMGWWLGSALVQIDAYFVLPLNGVLWLILLTAALLLYLDRVRGWNWLPASISLALLLPVMAGLALLNVADDSFYFSWPRLVPWMLLLAASYHIIFRLEELSWARRYYLALYSGWLGLVAAMLSLDLQRYFYLQVASAGDAYHALLVVLPVLLIWQVRQGRANVLQRFGLPLQQSMTALLLAGLSIWSLHNQFSNSGDASPLTYLPLLNPLDLAQLTIMMSMLRSLALLGESFAHYRKPLLAAIGGLAFIWISALFLRSMHHYQGVAFEAGALLSHDAVQTGLSILWTLIGMLTIVVASRRSMRKLWLAGAVLIALVLIKLIVFDLSASGTVERIVSFLVVGGLLVAMGYFSPIPPTDEGVHEPSADLSPEGISTNTEKTL